MIRAFYIAACRWLIARMPAEALDPIRWDAYAEGRDDEREQLDQWACDGP